MVVVIQTKEKLRNGIPIKKNLNSLFSILFLHKFFKLLFYNVTTGTSSCN